MAFLYFTAKCILTGESHSVYSVYHVSVQLLEMSLAMFAIIIVCEEILKLCAEKLHLLVLCENPDYLPLILLLLLLLLQGLWPRH